MQKFSYTRTGDRISLEAQGDLIEIAAEVGYMVRSIYGTLMKGNPEAANLFRAMVLVTIADPDTPTWDASAVNPDVAIAICTEKKD